MRCGFGPPSASPFGRWIRRSPAMHQRHVFTSDVWHHCHGAAALLVTFPYHVGSGGWHIPLYSGILQSQVGHYSYFFFLSRSWSMVIMLSPSHSIGIHLDVDAWSAVQLPYWELPGFCRLSPLWQMLSDAPLMHRAARIFLPSSLLSWYVSIRVLPLSGIFPPHIWIIFVFSYINSILPFLHLLLKKWRPIHETCRVIGCLEKYFLIILLLWSLMFGLIYEMSFILT